MMIGKLRFSREKKKREKGSIRQWEHADILMNRCCNNDVNRRVSGVRNDKSGRIRRESMYHNNCPLNISRSFASIIKKKKKKNNNNNTVDWFSVRVTTPPTDGIFPDFDQARFERKNAVTGSFYRSGIQVLTRGRGGRITPPYPTIVNNLEREFYKLDVIQTYPALYWPVPVRQ